MAREAHDPYVELAREAVEAYVREGRTVAPFDPLPPEMARRSGTFVSLKKGGALRGCIGTFLPTEANVAREVISNAIKSATGDPRFPPVEEKELALLVYSVDVLSEPAACQEEDLDPKCYGVIVERGWRCGLLLPDLKGVNTAAEQLAIARAKAGIHPSEPVRLYRFTVERHA